MRRFERQFLGIGKGARKIDQHDIPDRIEQDVALVRIEIADKILKDLLPADLEVVGSRLAGRSFCA